MSRFLPKEHSSRQQQKNHLGLLSKLVKLRIGQLLMLSPTQWNKQRNREAAKFIVGMQWENKQGETQL